MKKFLSILLAYTFLLSALVFPVNALDNAIVSIPEDRHTYEKTSSSWYKEAESFVWSEWLLTYQVTRVEIMEHGWRHYYYNFFGEREITRGEVATVIHRYDWNYGTLEGYKSSICTVFDDVPDGKWMTPAVQWAAECGIVNGVGGKYFAPERTITREEFATIMFRYTEYKDIECDTSASLVSFPDSAKVSTWAKDAVAWAVGEGLISGKPGGLLAPQDTITRAEVALIVYRYNNSVLAHRDNMK